VLGIDPAIDGGGEDHAAALLQPNIGVAPRRRVGRDIGARDSDQAAAIGKPRQRRADVPERGVGYTPLHVRHRRKGRIDDDDAWHNGGVEVIVDLCRVVAGRGDVGEE